MQSLTCSSEWLAATLSSEAYITSLSASAELFTGYSAQELAGRPIVQILADLSALEVPRILEAAKEWGSWQGEIVHRSRSGNHLEARGMVVLLSGHRNQAAEYLLLSNLSRTPVSAEGENSAVAEVAAKLRTVAHDLNNPLAVVMGFAQLLMLNQNCQGNMRGDIEKLYSELRRVIQIVERLHTYARSLHEQSQSNQTSNAAG
jgi:signal transduction histidine kinase